MRRERAARRHHRLQGGATSIHPPRATHDSVERHIARHVRRGDAAGENVGGVRMPSSFARRASIANRSVRCKRSTLPLRVFMPRARHPPRGRARRRSRERRGVPPRIVLATHDRVRKASTRRTRRLIRCVERRHRTHADDHHAPAPRSLRPMEVIGDEGLLGLIEGSQDPRRRRLRLGRNGAPGTSPRVVTGDLVVERLQVRQVAAN